MLQGVGRRALVVAAVAGFVLALPGAATATSVSPNPKRISAAAVAISPCGSLSGVGVSWTVTANVVTTVVLTAIPSSCTGGSLSLTLVDATNASLASAGPVTVSGTTQTISSLTGSATSTSVTGAYVSVVGP
jgi:hypothetical protein